MLQTDSIPKSQLLSLWHDQIGRSSKKVLVVLIPEPLLKFLLEEVTHRFGGLLWVHAIILKKDI